MIIAVLDENSRIVVMFDTEVHVDPGVEGVEISRDDLQRVAADGRLGDWLVEGGKVIHSPQPEPAVESSGQIPTAIL